MGEKILSTLVKLLEDQEKVKIKYMIEGVKHEEENQKQDS